MAEFAAVAAIIQVAESGLRLSTTLFTFAETIASADRTISTISKDVSLTSSVLKELANILAKDKNPRVYSDTAIESAIAVVDECSGLFQELHSMLIEKLPKHSSRDRDKASRTTLALERLKWPYLQPKMNLLQTNLDRLKSSLLVILNVISLAKMMRTEPSSADIGQTDLVKDLMKSNQEHIRKYEELKNSIPNHRQDPMLMDNMQEPARSASMAIRSSEEETKLHNLHHFILLFETLMNETSSASYEIGSQSRVRIEKHILSARASEVRSLCKVHGETTVRDVWGKLRPQASATFDSIGHESRPPKTFKWGIASLASLKRKKPKSKQSSFERPSDDNGIISQDLVPASGKESKSWLISSDSADDESLEVFCSQSVSSTPDIKPKYSRTYPDHGDLHFPRARPDASRYRPSTGAFDGDLDTLQLESEEELNHETSQSSQLAPTIGPPDKHLMIESPRLRNSLHYEPAAPRTSHKETRKTPQNVHIHSSPQAARRIPVARRSSSARNKIQFESKEYNTGDPKLDELLRLWTPV